MTSSPFRTTCLSLILAATLAGCGGSSNTAPASISQQQASEVAQQVAALLFLGPNPTSVPSSFTSPADRADHTGMNMHRRGSLGPMAVRAESDLSWSFDVRWYDASGGEQFWYDSTTTARVVTDQTARGSYSGEGYTATMGHAGHVDLAGLLASQPQIIVSATRNDTLDAAYSGIQGEAQLSLKCSGAYAQVSRLKPLEENPHPSAGTASWSIVAHRAFQNGQGSHAQNFNTSVLVTFNGTRFVPLVVNGQWHYTLDLETGQVTPVSV